MNDAVNGISEVIGVFLQEAFGEDRIMTFNADVRACKGMLLRTGTGKVNRSITEQLLVLGAMRSYGVVVQRVPRAESAEIAADILIHPVGSESPPAAGNPPSRGGEAVMDLGWRRGVIDWGRRGRFAMYMSSPFSGISVHWWLATGPCSNVVHAYSEDSCEIW